MHEQPECERYGANHGEVVKAGPKLLEHPILFVCEGSHFKRKIKYLEIPLLNLTSQPTFRGPLLFVHLFQKTIELDLEVTKLLLTPWE